MTETKFRSARKWKHGCCQEPSFRDELLAAESTVKNVRPLVAVANATLTIKFAIKNQSARLTPAYNLKAALFASASLTPTVNLNDAVKKTPPSFVPEKTQLMSNLASRINYLQQSLFEDQLPLGCRCQRDIINIFNMVDQV
ncbi:hypothetical protein H5187_20745 [Pseudoalteromonas sp. SG44-1]|uniref:hypothetical protein n=1 Tax=Pseudoalteromonas sp. SG44-1 TaxID=2760964 RepID=UPI001601E0C7|nr:hypothetical protein [Pseudoalteromonas sp. SG44-1]MBB1419675.1 hypothetical protein [Pseudoalteromonas sp. SG44-1]